MSTGKDGQIHEAEEPFSGEPAEEGIRFGDVNCSDSESDSPSKDETATHAPTENQMLFAQHTHAYIREYIALADRKAGFIFTIAGALLVYLYESGAVDWTGRLVTTDLVAAAGLVALVVSAVASVAVVIPRRPVGNSSLVYWGEIAKRPSASAYVYSATSATEERLAGELLAHSYDLAGICQRKYRTLAKALWSGAAGAVATLLFLVLD